MLAQQAQQASCPSLSSPTPSTTTGLREQDPLLDDLDWQGHLEHDLEYLGGILGGTDDVTSFNGSHGLSPTTPLSPTTEPYPTSFQPHVPPPSVGPSVGFPSGIMAPSIAATNGSTSGHSDDLSVESSSTTISGPLPAGLGLTSSSFHPHPVTTTSISMNNSQQQAFSLLHQPPSSTPMMPSLTEGAPLLPIPFTQSTAIGQPPNQGGRAASDGGHDDHEDEEEDEMPRGLLPPGAPNGEMSKRMKREIRMMKNRDAANRSRMRRKAEHAALEREVKALNERVHQLVTELQVLKTENTALKEQSQFLKYLLTKGYGNQGAGPATSVRHAGMLAGSALFGVALLMAFPWSSGLHLLTGGMPLGGGQHGNMSMARGFHHGRILMESLSGVTSVHEVTGGWAGSLMMLVALVSGASLVYHFMRGRVLRFLPQWSNSRGANCGWKNTCIMYASLVYSEGQRWIRGEDDTKES